MIQLKITVPVVTAGLFLVGCGANMGSTPDNPSSDLSRYYNQDVDWRKCGSSGGEASGQGSSQTCAEVDVPLDYADLSQGDISISVTRTTGPGGGKANDAHMGVILTNPGGPGASGLDFHPYMVEMFGKNVRSKFDIVSFDSRGVGKSAPAKCLDTKQMDVFMADLGTPNQLTNVDKVSQAAASMGQGCERESSRQLPYLSTNNTARDMDVLRVILDEQRINFYGASYGSNIGQVYATLFPSATGRFVLDGVVPMWLDLEQTGLGQAKGFNATFDRFIANCPKHRDCPLPANATQATAKVKKLLDGLGAKNLPADDSDGRQVTQAIAYNGVTASLYDDTYGWTQLREALRQAFAGDGTGLLELSDEYAEREDGKYGGILESYYAISCLDQDGRADAAATERLGKEWAKAAPMFGEYLAWTGLPCATWPAPVDLAPSHDNWSQLPAMLLINYSEDPATPFEWAEQVAQAMPQSSLIKVPGPNHVAAFNEIKCVDDAIGDFYLAGKLPASRVTCPLK